MNIKWNGHACFTLTNSLGHTLMTDPFNPGCGYESPKGSVDVVTISHHHGDHDYTELLTGFKAFDGVCKTEYMGFEISSIKAYHDECCGKKRGENLLFKIKADGQTVVHMGDIGHMPDAKQTEFITGADLMLIPIGGFYTIDTKTALEIIKAAKPKAVIPMHYKAEGNGFPISDSTEFEKLTQAVRIGNTAEISELGTFNIMTYKK